MCAYVSPENKTKQKQTNKNPYIWQSQGADYLCDPTIHTKASCEQENLSVQGIICSLKKKREKLETKKLHACAKMK